MNPIQVSAMMKHILNVVFSGLFVFTVQGQGKYYDFQIVKQIKTTPSKEIQRSGSCWAYAGTALLEAEWLKSGKPELDISEWNFIRNAYELKSNEHLKTKGNVKVDEKGIAPDVLVLMDHYGMVPEDMFFRTEEKPLNPNSAEMDAIIRATLYMVMEKESGNFTEQWKNTFDATLSAYLGEARINFPYQGKDYTPKSFAEASGLKANDFAILTSDNRQPFNQMITLPAKNNWNSTRALNVQSDQLFNSTRASLQAGHTVLWYGNLPADMLYQEENAAIVPAQKISDLVKKQTGEDKKSPFPEKNFTEQERQANFESNSKNELTYLLIYGMSKDKTGTEYFVAKKVCQADNTPIHLSPGFFRFNTGFIMLNKKGLPSDVRSRF